MSAYAASAFRRSPTMTPATPMLPSIADHNVSNHMSRSGGPLAHSQHVYNQARNTLYSRYSTSDWDTSNKTYFNMSEKERSLAERLRSDAWQAIKATDQQTRVRQASNTKKLSERVTDITFWKEELMKEIRAAETEMDNLKEFKRVLEKALDDTRQPLAIAEECLIQREKRTGIDQVHDDVERNLTKEVETIKKCQVRMQNLIDKANVQLRMSRAAQNACDCDARDKHHAQGLDDRMHQLHNTSSSIGLFPGIENVDNTITVPVSWMKFTQDNITRSQKERENSEKLRGDIDACLRQCANDMWSHFNTANNAFNTRIQETTDAKNKLQAHLQRTCNEIKDMDRAICLLKKAIADKEAPMKVAQTRLDERTRRINVELCNDPVMQGLQKEVDEIRESVRTLKDKLRAADSAMCRLQKTRATLEHDISVKERSLEIDAKSCMGMRKNMPLDPKIGPILNMPLVSY